MAFNPADFGAIPVDAPTAGSSPTPTSSTSFDPSAFGAVPVDQAPEPKKTGGLFDSLKSAFDARTKTVAESNAAYTAGKQSLPSTIFQDVGEFLGAGTDIAGEALKGGAKLALNALPKPAQDAAKKIATTEIGAGKAAYDAGVNTVADGISNDPRLQKFALSDAGAATERNIKEIPNYTNIIPAGEGAGAAVDAVGSGVRDVTGAAMSKLPSPLTKNYLPDVAKDFASEGIVPPVSAVTKNPLVRNMEAIASKSAFGTPVADISKNAAAQIEQKTNAIVDSLKPQKSMSDENLGKTMQEGIGEYEDHFKTTMNDFYEKFTKVYGNNPTPITATESTLKDVLAQQGQDLFKGVDPRVKGLLDKLVGENADTTSMRRNGFPEDVAQGARTPAKVDFGTLKSTRTAVGEALSKEPDNSALKRIYGALSSDMESSVQNFANTGSPEAVAAKQEFAAINDAYSSGKAQIESRIASSISQSNPERIAQNIITRNSADTLKVLREMIGEPRFAELSKAFLRQQFEGAVTRGKFDLDKLKKALSGYDTETLAQVLTPDQKATLDAGIQQLEKMQRLSEAMKPAQKIAEGSQTAYLTKTARISTAVGALFAGNLAAFVAIIGSLAGDYGISKLFSTEAGRKFLTGGAQASEDAVQATKSITDTTAAMPTPKETTGPNPSKALPATKPTKSAAKTEVSIPKKIPQKSTQDLIKEAPSKTKKNAEDFLKGMPPSKETPSSYRPDSQRGFIKLPSFGPKAQVSALSQATNALKEGSISIKPGAIERAMKELRAGKSRPVRVRKLTDGKFVIEDGRHRVEAARRLGIKKLPIEDVTDQY